MHLAGTGRRKVPYELSGRWDGTDYVLKVGNAYFSVLAAKNAASVLTIGLRVVTHEYPDPGSGDS